MKYDVMRYDVTKYVIMKYDIMRYDVMKYDVMKHDVMNDDVMKMKETSFWRLCLARANATLVVLVQSASSLVQYKGDKKLALFLNFSFQQTDYIE